MRTHTFAAGLLGPVLGAVLQAVPASSFAVQHPPAQPRNYLEREVRHQLVLLPFYTIFDDLAFKVDGYTVTLMGETANTTLKEDAENAVKHIEGVQKVINNIKLLPVSPMDDQIRRAEYRAIYGDPTLNRYALQAVGPIHIIVENGHVTLVGVVANEMDKNVAGLRANGVSGVFSVNNQLQVEGK